MTANCLIDAPMPGRPALLTGAAAVLALLTGCAGTAPLHSASAAAQKAASTADRAVAQAEAAVQRNPQDAATRAALGQAYLSAGRFQSAATALGDAMALGDNSARTALALALAEIGANRPTEAVALLDDWRGEIPAADLGLALALAGETARGVAVLSDAVRSGESSPKLRQNLAYAYALDGRWSEARLIAGQDLPAAELDQRIAIWALSALPDRNQDRVAGLLQAPLRTDPGQPSQLALRTDAVREQVAVETSAPQRPAAAPPVATAPSELPALSAPVSAPAVADAAAALPSVLEQNLAAQSHATPAPAAPGPSPVAAHAHRPRPSVATAFAPMTLPTNPPQPAQVAVRAVAQPVSQSVSARVRLGAGGTHLVQLGAFSSQQGARRAWGIFVHRTPRLASYRMAIAQATVRGKVVWRVAAAGLVGSEAASGLCSRVKSSGGACFAYAAPLPAGAMPQPMAPGRDVSAVQRARR